MDFKPANRHVQQARWFGARRSMPPNVRVVAYVSPASRLAAVIDERRSVVGPRFWVTFWRHYTPEEALRELRLEDTRGQVRSWRPADKAWELTDAFTGSESAREHVFTYPEFRGQASDEGGGAMFAPRYEDWSATLAELSENTDRDPELYKRATDALTHVMTLPGHTDRDRPESTARLVVRWVWPDNLQPDKSMALSGAALATCVLETEDKTPATEDDRVLAAELDVTLSHAFEKKIDNGTQVAELLKKKVERAGFPPGEPYDDAWRLIRAWLAGTDSDKDHAVSGSSDFEAWLAKNPGFPSIATSR